MTLPVGGIVELVGPDRAMRFRPREFLGEPPRDFDVVVRILVGNRRHLAHLGAAKPQHVLLFLALRLGDDDHRSKAERVADEGEADAGIARGALDDDPAGLQQSPFHGVADDVQRRPILDRAAGIEKLRLAEDFAAGLFGSAREAKQGGVADRADETVANVHDLARSDFKDPLKRRRVAGGAWADQGGGRIRPPTRAVSPEAARPDPRSARLFPEPFLAKSGVAEAEPLKGDDGGRVDEPAVVEPLENLGSGNDADADILVFMVQAVQAADAGRIHPAAEQRDGFAAHAGTDEKLARELQVLDLASGFLDGLAAGHVLRPFALVDDPGDDFQEPRRSNFR